MIRSTKLVFIILVIINLAVIGWYLLVWEGGYDADQHRALFLSAEYDEYLDQTSIRDSDPDILYWRVLSHIYNADLSEAKSELSKLDFSNYSATTLDILQVLNKLENNDVTWAIQYMDSRPTPYNIRERGAKNMLYTLALLSQPNPNKDKLRIERDEITRNNPNARLTILMNAAITSVLGQHSSSYTQFEKSHNQKNITEPLFWQYWGMSAFNTKAYDQALVFFDYINQLSEDPSNNQYFGITKKSFIDYKYQSLYYLEDYKKSLELINSSIEDINIWWLESADTWIWKSRNEIELWLDDASRDSLVQALTYKEWYYRVMYDMIKHHARYPDRDNFEFIQRYMDQYIDTLPSNRLMQLYTLWIDQWEASEANRIKRYLLAKYPDYEPAKLIDRKEVIDRYVVQRLRFDQEGLEQIEEELVTDFGLDIDTNIILATQRLDMSDEWQALRYGQIAKSTIDLHAIQQYLIMFLGYLEQDRVRDVYEARETQIDQDATEAYATKRDLALTGNNYLSWDAVYSGDVLIQNLAYSPKVSELNRAYLKRWLADQTGRDSTKSRTVFEIEALRGQYEALTDEDIEPLFKKAFARYYNFWDKYFKNPEEEDDKLVEE